MHRAFLRFLTLLLFLTTFFSCSSQESPRPAKSVSLPKLAIGLPPERNIFRQIERYEPLMRYVGKKAGVEFELKVLPGYAKIVNDFEEMHLDGAFYGSFTYAIASAQMGHRVIARPEDLAGVSTYRGLLFVRSDSPIRSAGDMRGKRMAVADIATTAGSLLCQVFFAENRIGDPNKFFKELYYAGGHDTVFRDVIDGRADVGAAKDTVFRRMMVEDPGMKAGMIRVLAATPGVPENGLAFRPGVDKDLLMKIRDTLLSMERDPEGAAILKEFGARRFIETSDVDYDVVRSYAKKAGTDPSTVDLRE